jgi:YD repeat-containing protein
MLRCRRALPFLALVCGLSIGALADPVRYIYDESGRLTKVSYPSGTTVTYTYDKAGNLLSREVASAKPAPQADAKREQKKKR